MDMEEYMRQNPDFAKQNTKKYTCALCKKSFDKPKVYYLGSFVLELGVYILAVFGALFFGLWVLIIPIVYSFIRLCSRKKGCPFCKSENIFKNY